MIIRDICEWNEVRDNTEFNGALEFSMLAEELDEFAFAQAKTLQDKFGIVEDEEEFKKIEKDVLDYINSEEGKLDIKVNQADAIADILFVAVGTLYKLVGDMYKVEDILSVVIAANNLKSKDKNEDGKITKPEGFVGPEKLIKEIIKGK